MKIIGSIKTLSLTLAGATLLMGCPGAQAPGSQMECAGEQRVVRDCSNEIDYQTLKGKGGVKIMDVVSFESELEKKAIRKVSETIQQFKMAQQEACKDYNSCILSEADYRKVAEDTRAKMLIVPAVMESLQNAKSTQERIELIDKLYQGVVPAAERDELTFKLGVKARLPDSLGSRDVVLRQGSSLPTDSRMHFEISVSKTAHLYMFQTTPTGEITVLFPNPKISGTNPLQANQPSRIPLSGKTFRVNEKDLGTEKVFFLLSDKPIANVETAFQRVLNDQIANIGDDPWLSSMAAAQSGSPACERGLEVVDEPPAAACERGLEVVDDPSAGEMSMIVRNNAAEDRILRILEFKHVSQENYQP